MDIDKMKEPAEISRTDSFNMRYFPENIRIGEDFDTYIL